VRAGIGSLVAAGMLSRRQGKGTFVTKHERDVTRQHFSKVFDLENRTITPTGEVVMSFKRQRADARALALLALDADKTPHVYTWDTIVQVKEHAVSLRHVTVPAHLFPGLTAGGLRDNLQNLYALYQSRWGVSVIRMEDRVFAVKAGPRAKTILRIKRGQPLLQIDRVAFTYGGVPVELRSRIYDSSRFFYRADQAGIS
jgi:GntR family transcriptional regulator